MAGFFPHFVIEGHQILMLRFRPDGTGDRVNVASQPVNRRRSVPRADRAAMRDR